MAMDSKARTWVRRIGLGFLCVTVTVTFAIAGGHRQAEAQTPPRAQATSGYVPPGMHEAQADVDVGPGSDEAQLVGSSWAE